MDKKKNSKTYQTCGGKINLEGEKKKERRRDRSVRNYQRNCTQYKFSGERGTIEKNFRDKSWKKKRDIGQKDHWTVLASFVIFHRNLGLPRLRAFPLCVD